MSVDTQVVTSRSEQQKQIDTVTNYIQEKYGDDIKDIIGSITEDLIYTTDSEKYLAGRRPGDLHYGDLLYGTIYIDYRKNGEIEVYCGRNSRSDVGTTGKTVAESFRLHIKQGSGENADITIEVNGPSTTHNQDLLLENVKKYAYPLNEIVTAANEMYKNLTQPPVAVAPVAVAPVVVAPPKPTNASTPKPLSMAERIALFNKKGGRRSRRHRRKSHKKSRKSRKSHKKSRKSQRRQ